MHIAVGALVAYLVGSFALGFIAHAAVTAQAPPPPTVEYAPVQTVTYRHHHRHYYRVD